jgi:hypothetical protein
MTSRRVMDALSPAVGTGLRPVYGRAVVTALAALKAIPFAVHRERLPPFGCARVDVDAARKSR